MNTNISVSVEEPTSRNVDSVLRLGMSTVSYVYNVYFHQQGSDVQNDRSLHCLWTLNCRTTGAYIVCGL